MNDTPGKILQGSFRGAAGSFAVDLDFSIPATGITGVFGPSGSGKTTLLRCIAGLQNVPGHLKLDNEVWQDSQRKIFVPAFKRSIGYIFQDTNLFPHLSVAENLDFGARRLPPETKENISGQEAIDILALDTLLSRQPGSLSGGEKQRVAIGRALLSQPGLLLMDEPLSALDRNAREEILPYLEKLHSELSIPCIYVSHDMREIERLADTLMLVANGRITASGPLHELEADSTLPLLQSAEAAVTLNGTVVSTDSLWGLASVDVGGEKLVIATSQPVIGEKKRLRIKAADVSFTLQQPENSSILNCLPVEVVSLTGHDTDPAHVTVLATLARAEADTRIIGRITRKSASTLDLQPGKKVIAQIKSVALVR